MSTFKEVADVKTADEQPSTPKNQLPRRSGQAIGISKTGRNYRAGKFMVVQRYAITLDTGGGNTFVGKAVRRSGS